MNKSKEHLTINFNLRERNNSLVRIITDNIDDNQYENNVISNLNKNTSLKLLSSNDDCSICLNKIKKNQIARETSCLHKFHAQCLDRWLEEKSTCPLCKKNLLVSSS